MYRQNLQTREPEVRTIVQKESMHIHSSRPGMITISEEPRMRVISRLEILKYKKALTSWGVEDRHSIVSRLNVQQGMEVTYQLESK